MHRAQISDLRDPEVVVLLLADGHLLQLGGSGAGFRRTCGPNPRGNFPNIAAQFAADCRIGRRIAAFGSDPAQAIMESGLRAPTNGP